MKCYICQSQVKRKWINGGVRIICTNNKCKAPQDDCEAYAARKARAIGETILDKP